MVEKTDLIEKAKTKARQALLDMAENYTKKKGMIQHAIEAYKEVIVADPEAKEADEARESLMNIAQEFERAGKRESAFHIYRKLARELPRSAPRHPVKY